MKQYRKAKLAESRSMMSVLETEGEKNSDAPRVGADLRAARNRLGWDLPEIAAGLRIRLPYLEALESGRITDLPGNAYALGFLRTYAVALGLDPDELSRRFKAEAALVNRRTELTFPAPVPERGVPAGAIVLLGAVLAIGAYVGWYRLSGEGKLPAEVVAPIPARLAPLAEQATPQPWQVIPDAPSAASASPHAGVAADAVVSPSSPSPASPSSADQVPSLPSPPVEAQTVVGQTGPTTPPPTTRPAAAHTAATATASQPSDSPRIVVRAKSDSWIQVRDRAGQVLLNRVLHPGDTWPVPVRANLLLTTGNAGGTELLVDGLPTPGLGALGAVRRDLPLDPDQIKEGKLASISPPTSTHAVAQ